MKNKIFDNEQRHRYYGVRVGDTVSEKGIGKPRIGVVKKYGFMDNNAIYVKVEGCKELQKFIPEWCDIIEKVEDKK